MYKHSKELAKALGLESKITTYCAYDCEYEPPALTSRCPCIWFAQKQIGF